MKIRVAHNILAPAVSQIARYISAKPNQPELAGMILETFTNGENTYLRLVGYDGAATAKTVIPVTVEEEGRILVTGHLFADVIRDLPGGQLTLDTTGAESEVKIAASRGVYSFPLLDSSSFPALPVMPEESGKVDASLFASAVAQVSRAASKELEKYKGVLLEFTKDEITLVATDTYRMARRTIPWNGTEDMSTSIYLDAKALASAATQFARSNEVRIAFGSQVGNNIGFANDSAAVIIQQGNNTFPSNYGNLFIEEFTSTATVSLDVLVDAAKRIGKFAVDNAPAKFALSKNQMVISASQAGSGGGVETIEIEHNDEEFEIFFNPGFLVDGLNALGTEQAVLGFNGSSKAATLIARGGLGKFTYLVMPVRDKSALPSG